MLWEKMKIITETIKISEDSFVDFDRFLVTIKDENGYNKTITVDCYNTVKHIWKITDKNILFRAIYPLLKKEIKEKMNKGIMTVEQLPDFSFTSLKIPKYPPNESFSLPDTFYLNNESEENKVTENDNPFICNPNLYGVGIIGKKFLPWSKKKIKHITKHFSGFLQRLRRFQNR
jgi:hypothetical protein